MALKKKVENWEEDLLSRRKEPAVCLPGNATNKRFTATGLNHVYHPLPLTSDHFRLALSIVVLALIQLEFEYPP
jgi:hypothetical protein